jgi:hypothetical protein
MKKEEHRINQLLAVCAIVLLGYTLFAVIHKNIELTGEASSQTATVSFTVQGNETGGTNVTNATFGGNSGGSSPKDVELGFSTSLSSLSVKLIPGSETIRVIRIKNLASLTLDFVVSSSSANVVVKPTSFRLVPSEEREITVILRSGQNNINTAKISIKTSFAEKIIPVVTEVQSQNALFAAELVIPPGFKAIKPSGEIFSTTTISPLEGGHLDLRYVLIDANNKIVYEEREQVKATNMLIVEKTFRVPTYLEEGTYAFGVIATYKGETQVDSTLITIKSSAKQPTLEQPLPPPRKSYVLLLAIIFFMLVHHIMKKRIRKAIL